MYGAPKKRRKKKRKHTLLSIILSFFLICFFTGCIVGGYILANAFSVINGDTIVNLAEVQSSENQTSFVYYYDSAGKEKEYIRLHGEINRVWVGLGQIPKALIDAFIALEDKRFYSHKGVDWYRLGGVISSLSFSEGASTITQQLIKNVTNEKDVTVIRKYSEILSALNLERRYQKNDVLEAYLNTAYFGSGCYGVKTAAETYFGKELNELTVAECAVIASITKAPYSYNPLYNLDKNLVRQKFCLSEMLDQDLISQQEYDEAVSYELILTNDPRFIADPNKQAAKAAKEAAAKPKYNFYVDFVIDSVISDLMSQLGYSKSEATSMIFYGGLKIYCAVDTAIQDKLEQVYSTRKVFPNPNEKDTKESPAVQSAMTIMDYKGRVVGIVGQAGPKEGNRCLNRAAKSPRQPGSSLKPLAVYAPGVNENRITWSTKILDKGFVHNGKMWPHNQNGTLGSGNYTTVQYAIQVSYNTVPARVIKDYLPKGTNTSLSYLINNFHLSHVDKVKDNALAPFATGAMTNGVTTLEMAAAYAVFGNGGYYYKPYCYYEVLDNKGMVLLSNKDIKGEQVLTAETADVMCELLQTVPTSQYGSYSAQKYPIMCKTGTTTDNKDRWFCAGTPYYVSATWFGYDKPKDLNLSSNPCGKICLEVYSSIHAGLPVKQFEKSGKTIKKSYCASSGNIMGSNCAFGGYGWYKTATLPPICNSCKPKSQQVIEDVIDTVGDAVNNIVDNLLPWLRP